MTITELPADFIESYWKEKYTHLDDRTVIVDGHHYKIADENGHPNAFRGHSGIKFTIRFHDGREVVTTNLWSQGKIPEAWRDRLPDNAIFVKASHG